jgi:hypothetical protein
MPRELKKVVDFLGLKTTAEQIAVAVERSAIRRMEQAQSENCELTKGSRKDLSFIRSAGSGCWVRSRRLRLRELRPPGDP